MKLCCQKRSKIDFEKSIENIQNNKDDKHVDVN